jgi:DNA-binding NarL/FixJ family response regulator
VLYRLKKREKSEILLTRSKVDSVGRRMDSSISKVELIRVGVLTDEPLRLAGLASIFAGASGDGGAQLTPIIGKLEELLSDNTLGYLIIDLNSSPAGVGILEIIRLQRPEMKLIVLGPEGNDELVLESIRAGARAYLDLKAGPRVVRQAVEEVTRGSIWASRRLLSKLIDRLLVNKDTSLTYPPLHLTERERQVLDLILTASSNREIANQLGIEERTVQAHVGRLMRKTGSDNRIELSMRALNGSLLIADNEDRRRDDRRQADRRQTDRRHYLESGQRSVTHE